MSTATFIRKLQLLHATIQLALLASIIVPIFLGKGTTVMSDPGLPAINDYILITVATICLLSSNFFGNSLIYGSKKNPFLVLKLRVYRTSLRFRYFFILLSSIVGAYGYLTVHSIWYFIFASVGLLYTVLFIPRMRTIPRTLALDEELTALFNDPNYIVKV